MGVYLQKIKKKKKRKKIYKKRPAATLTKIQLAILNYHVLDESKF